MSNPNPAAPDDGAKTEAVHESGGQTAADQAAHALIAPEPAASSQAEGPTQDGSGQADSGEAEPPAIEIVRPEMSPPVEMSAPEEPAVVESAREDELSASPRLFDDPRLEKLSRTPWTFPLVYLPVAFIFLVIGAVQMPFIVTVMGLAFGYFAWTLCEYSVHRWLFHADFKGSSGERIHYLLHGVHHAHPNDPLRLVMPPLMSVPLMLLATIVILLVIVTPGAFVVLAGFLFGYVAYDQLHFHVHHREPRTDIERTLRRLHMLHHFRDPTRGFGVSAPYWDSIFSTDFAKSDQAGSTPL